ncbi:hypothetical protein POM88_050037 [Heracleum sosnowskyi]|uniref:Bromo domain-containing protein n=1 Tax=Heracleum sosnowskyi TaxID=360622 RepID=A0AAD8GY13_9APIA|nr:hypothetical protein POM88_050037 [Heracleum sosnowskyi]
MKQCRLVLRRAASADKERVFCNLLGRTLLNPNDNDDEGLLGYPAMVSRPLDFRTVDLRLAAGAYGGSHEAFFEDVQEVWCNIRKAYGNHSKLTDLAETLSRTFRATLACGTGACAIVVAAVLEGRTERGHDLLEFARDSVVVYLEDEDAKTRKDAALRLLLLCLF